MESEPPKGYSKTYDAYFAFTATGYESKNFAAIVQEIDANATLIENPTNDLVITLYDEPLKVSAQKTYISEDGNKGTFYFGLYDEKGELVGDVRSLTITGTAGVGTAKQVDFYIPADRQNETFYLYELQYVGEDEYKKVNSGDVFTVDVTNEEGSGEQNVALTVKDNGVKVGGTVKFINTDTDAVESSSITISKQDMGGAPISGKDQASYELRSETSLQGVEINGNTLGDVMAYSFTGNNVVINGLPDGTYTLQETAAPDGYTVVSEFTFTIKDGEIIDTDTSGVTNGAVEFKDNRLIVKDEVTRVTVSKQDMTNSKELPGAKLTITSKDGKELSGVTGKRGGEDVTITVGEMNSAITFTSGKNATVLEKLPAGVYTLTEEIAPDGYTVAKEITFRVNADSTIDVQDKDGKWTSADDVTMRDDVTRVKVSKVDVTGQEELAGAELALYLKSDLETNGDKAKAIDQWQSGTSAHEITRLADGEYVLVETVAPDGYTITSDTVFTLEDGKVVGSTDNTILVEDTTSKITFSKKALIGGEELSGASMQLTYTGEGDLTKVTSENKTVQADGKTITWTSEDKETVLERLPDGDYTLEETAAPDGYEITTEITFTIENGVIANPKVGESKVNKVEGNVVTLFDAVKAAETTAATTETTQTETSTTTTTTETSTTTSTTTTTTTATSTTETTTSTTTTTTTVTSTTETTTSTTTTTTTATSTTETTTSTTTTTATATSTTETTTYTTTTTATVTSTTETTTYTTTTTATVTSTTETTTSTTTTTTTPETTTTSGTTSTMTTTTTPETTSTTATTITPETTSTTTTTTTPETTSTTATTTTPETTSTTTMTTTPETTSTTTTTTTPQTTTTTTTTTKATITMTHPETVSPEEDTTTTGDTDDDSASETTTTAVSDDSADDSGTTTSNPLDDSSIGDENTTSAVTATDTEQSEASQTTTEATEASSEATDTSASTQDTQATTETSVSTASTTVTGSSSPQTGDTTAVVFGLAAMAGLLAAAMAFSRKEEQ